jgi:hypothetical protein
MIAVIFALFIRILRERSMTFPVSTPKLYHAATIGRRAAGAAENIDLGTLGNTIAGAIGGGAGGQLSAC